MFVIHSAVAMNTFVTGNINSTEERDSFTICIEENFGKTISDCSNCSSLEDAPTWTLVLHSIANVTQILASFICCALVLILVMKYKKLQHRAIIVSLSLISADILLVCSYHLPAFTSTVIVAWPFEFIGCEIFGFLSTTFGLTRWYMMGVLSADRFFTVRYPFSYEKYSKVILTLLTLAAWIVPILISMTCLNILSSVAFRHSVPTCQIYAPTLDKGLLFFSVMTAISFLVGCILPTAFYVWLYHKARTLRPSATRLGRMTVQIAAGTVIQVRLGPLERDRHEKRALVTFVLIFITFFLTSVPIVSLQLFRAVSVDLSCKIPIFVHFLSVQFFLSSTLLDPILIMRDRDFRKCLQHLFSCHSGLESDHDTTQMYASDTYHSRRSDSVDMISYRGRRGSLCPSTGSASRIYGEMNQDSLAVAVGNETENHRRGQLSTLHEHLSESSISNDPCLAQTLQRQDCQVQVDIVDVQTQCPHIEKQQQEPNCVSLSKVTHPTDTNSSDSQQEEICIPPQQWTCANL